MEHILVVEDDQTTAMGIEYALQGEGYGVKITNTLKEAQASYNKDSFDLILLDLNLPDGSGYQFCQEVRQRSKIPIIFLTAVEEEANIVMGFDFGADDYITKPFRLRELHSRIKAALRRAGSSEAERLTAGNISIIPSTGKVYRDHLEINLTALEYRLLLTLFNHKNSVFTRDYLLSSIWDDAGNYVTDNTLTVYIKRLREKIEENPQDPQIIVTVRGRGYQVKS